MSGAAELIAGVPNPVPQADAATSHVWSFVFMLVLMLMFGIGRVAKETKTSVRWKSFLHLWMVAYLVLLTALMSVTTAMALVLLIDEKGQPRVSFIPASFISMTAAVLGVFGFEFLSQVHHRLRREPTGSGDDATELRRSGGRSHSEKGNRRVDDLGIAASAFSSPTLHRSVSKLVVFQRLTGAEDCTFAAWISRVQNRDTIGTLRLECHKARRIGRLSP